MASNVFNCKKCNSNNIVIRTTGQNKSFGFEGVCYDCGLKIKLDKTLEDSVYLWTRYKV